MTTPTLSRASVGFASVVALAAGFVGCAVTPQEDLDSRGSQITSCASGTTVRGVDVSHYDGTVKWTTAKAAGISFGFAKATEGTTLVDAQFAANWSGMKAAGVVRGAYHFFHPGSDAAAQAEFVVDTVGALGPADLPIVCDLEDTDGLSSAQVVANALTFMKTVTQMSGKTAILYASPGFLSSFGGLAAYPLWVANYDVNCPTVPAAWSKWQFWQSGDTGSVGGISSDVDINVYNGTLAQLTAFAAGSGAGGAGGDAGGGGSTGGGGATSCAVSGEAGVCIATSACAAQGGTSTAGHCPGAANIECCTGAGGGGSGSGGSRSGGPGSGGSGGGAACSSDGDCNPGSEGSGQICVGKVCVEGCNADWQCPGNTTCQGGSCQ